MNGILNGQINMFDLIPHEEVMTIMERHPGSIYFRCCECNELCGIYAYDKMIYRPEICPGCGKVVQINEEGLVVV